MTHRFEIWTDYGPEPLAYGLTLDEALASAQELWVRAFPNQPEPTWEAFEVQRWEEDGWTWEKRRILELPT